MNSNQNQLNVELTSTIASFKPKLADWDAELHYWSMPKSHRSWTFGYSSPEKAHFSTCVQQQCCWNCNNPYATCHRWRTSQPLTNLEISLPHLAPSWDLKLEIENGESLGHPFPHLARRPCSCQTLFLVTSSLNQKNG